VVVDIQKQYRKRAQAKNLFKKTTVRVTFASPARVAGAACAQAQGVTDAIVWCKLVLWKGRFHRGDRNLGKSPKTLADRLSRARNGSQQTTIRSAIGCGERIYLDTRRLQFLRTAANYF